ncbi:SGNH/GDSL hydrolase family protein [Arthrobacter glacialis]|uniref:SGNH/GDSL hydrolase family protein n=1 Tax=Arthrobacter glacialis TaxID=1664 RepID=UPI0013FD6909|nr:SGNH/GDSL hydrolase family protein [Arthrobacter glacialis]
MLIAGMAVAGIGLSAATVQPATGSHQLAGGMSKPTGPDPSASGTPAPLTISEVNSVPDGIRAKDQRSGEEVATPWDLPAGSMIFNPASGREEVTDPAIARLAVLFGDSQAAGAAGVNEADTWVQLGLAERGYKVKFLGGGGIGFAAKTPSTSNYADSLDTGRKVLPYGNPALVVVQGGGNDASQGIADARILSNADRLLHDLKASYPNSEFLFIGTLAKGQGYGGGRRSQVDALLAGFAQRNGIRFISAGDWVTRYGVGDKLVDGVHLNRGGHQALAKVLATDLKAMGIRGPGAK